VRAFWLSENIIIDKRISPYWNSSKIQRPLTHHLLPYEPIALCEDGVDLCSIGANRRLSLGPHSLKLRAIATSRIPTRFRIKRLFTFGTDYSYRLQLLTKRTTNDILLPSAAREGRRHSLHCRVFPLNRIIFVNPTARILQTHDNQCTEEKKL